MAAVLVGAAVVVVVVAFRPAGEEGLLRRPAPAFETFDLEGQPVKLADYRGKAVLVNFWASWCVPCRKEFPLLKEVHGDQVVVLGVVFRDERRTAAAFMRDQGATWPGLIDPKGQIAAAYGVRLKPGIPVTVAIDAGGVVVARHIGELREQDLDRLVAAAS